MSDDPKEDVVISTVVEDLNADIYFYSAKIDDEGFGKLVGAIAAGKTKPNALLILVTNGGSANAA